MFERRGVAAAAGSVAVAATIGFGLGGAPGSAQDASPAATGGGDLPSRPAAIVAGTYDAPGDVVFPLTDVASNLDDTTPGADAGTSGSSGSLVSEAEGLGEVLAVSNTQLEVSVDAFLTDEHAVVVLESADRADVVAVCGNVVGTGDSLPVQSRGGQVLVRMEERNGSGLRGIAILTELGPESATVSLLLAPSGSAVLATPESAPAP